MNITRSTFRQHEELRVPQGWTDQEKALVVQIENLLDQLFNRFGRLKFTDLGPELQQLLNGGLSDVTYDSVDAELEKTVNGSTSVIVSAATLKADMALDNVENKSSAAIRNELTSSDVTTALGYTPLQPGVTWGQLKNVI